MCKNKCKLKLFICLINVIAAIYSVQSQQGYKPISGIHTQNDASGRILLYLLDYEGYVSYIPQVEKNGAWGNEKKIGENVKVSSPDPGDHVILKPGSVFRAAFKELVSCLNSQARIVLFGLTSSGAVHYSIQDKFEPDNWSAWKSLGAAVFTQLAAIQNAEGALQLFGLTMNGNVLYSVESYDPLDPKKFTDWKSLNALDLDQIVCEKSPHGGNTVFAKNKLYGSVYFNSQLQPGSDNWRGWKPLDGTELKSIAVTKNPDERFSLFAVGGDERVYERYQLIPNGNWSDWTTQNGNSIKQILSEKSKAGYIHVFALNKEGHVDVIWQLGAGGNSWSGWFPFGGPKFRYITSCRHEDGRMILFVVDNNLEIQFREQLNADGPWDEWKKLIK